MKDYTHKLEGMLERGEKGKPGYAKLCEEVRQKREARKGPYVQRVYESLRKLLPEAEANGIKFGIENREALEELPLEGDFQSLFREFAGLAIGYWHDTGHAQIKENLGFINHASHLESLRDRLLGFHIHDVQFPARDHCAPGSGTIDWAALRPMVKPEHIKVFEFSPALTAEEAKRGVEYVKAIWGDK